MQTRTYAVAVDNNPTRPEIQTTIRPERSCKRAREKSNLHPHSGRVRPGNALQAPSVAAKLESVDFGRTRSFYFALTLPPSFAVGVL